MTARRDIGYLSASHELSLMRPGLLRPNRGSRMQKITVDLIRLAVSGAVICAVVGAAEWEVFTIAISPRPRGFTSHSLSI